MARNKKSKRSVGLRKTPRKPVGRSPRMTKPRLIGISEHTTKKRRSSELIKKIRQQKGLRREILRERCKPTDHIDLVMQYPPILPPPPPIIVSGSSRRKNKECSALPSENELIVIDSEDDSNLVESALFYEDRKGGFADKTQIPRYDNNNCGYDESVMLIESTLEEGEIRDDDDIPQSRLKHSTNEEEIHISDDDEDCEGAAMPVVPNDVDDQSVIFCSEIIDLDRENVNKPLEFIPIGFDSDKPRSKKRSPNKRARKGLGEDSSDKSEQDASHEEREKRMVIIDGNNVAFGHLQGKTFSVKGLDICIQYFKKLGHEVKAIVPQFRLKKEKSTDQRLLEELYKNGDVLLAPSKNLPGQRSSSYDDRLIISVAEKFDGVIISNDNFRDLLTVSDSWKEIIGTRVIGYTWAMDAFFVPDDPYGRHGPKLKDMLERKTQAASKEK